MEFIIELLLELILEGTLEMSQNKKVPKVVRYPLIAFLIVLFLGVTALIIFTGILAYQEINRYCGIVLIFFGMLFFITSIVKFKKLYLEKKK